jgi:uncharacterized protein
MKQIKSYFKVAIKAVNGAPSITEVKYQGADGQEYTGLQFEGYASTVDIDRTRDVVLPTAFSKFLEQYMTNPIILLQHDSDKPIGSIVEATIDDTGLYVKGIVKSDKENIFQDLRTGVIKTMSFGYRVNDYDLAEAEQEGKRIVTAVIKELELFEISLVSVPMNPNAMVKSKDEIMSQNLNDEEYKTYFQLNKKDEYSMEKSLSDLVKMSLKEVENEETVVSTVVENEISTVENTEAIIPNTEEEIIESEQEITAEVVEEEEKEEIVDPIEEITEEIKENEDIVEDKDIIDDVLDEDEDEVEEIIEEVKEGDEVVAEQPIEPLEIQEEVIKTEDEPEVVIKSPEEPNIETPENEAWEGDGIDQEVVVETENVETEPTVSADEVKSLKETVEVQAKSLSETTEKLDNSVKANEQLVKSFEDLTKRLEDETKANELFKSETSQVLKECVNMIGVLQNALKKISADSLLLYVAEEKQANKEEKMLDTSLAKKLLAAKSA